MQTTFETPRLRLIQIKDTHEGSQHLQWFHELWNNEVATSWSLHGKCNTIQESQQWMIESMEKLNDCSYFVFVKPESDEQHGNELGELIGSLGLSNKGGSPAIPPPTPPGWKSLKGDESHKDFDVIDKMLGYAFLQKAWGKGYATEAGKALLSEYAASVEERKGGKKFFYVEAAADEGNPASVKVLKKLGLALVGWKHVDGQAFLGGAWRDGGYWVYGKYV